MPRGYPDTKTCPNCKEWSPAEYSYCPWCGADLYKKQKKEAKVIKVDKR